MPLYEYQCEKCGELFEVMQKFADAPLTKHETCGGDVHRLLSAPALQFKGSGWYVNDYAKGSSNGGNSSGSSEKKSESKKSESSTPSTTPSTSSTDKS